MLSVGLQDSVRLITLAPGHFHAALIQKSNYDSVSSLVHVYAPEGKEVESHLKLITSFNNRAQDPTSWIEKVYTGDDFLARMIEEKKGNVVVIAGNNEKKTSYIKASVEAGLNVLADKPMAIDNKGFEDLKSAFELAEKNKVLVYDIMTERFEITNLLQKELSQESDLFGELVKGTPENPAITKESVHHFYKTVSGAPLIRPVWYYDVEQEGSGIVDVTTHLVDLIQWACFPGVSLDYKSDIKMLSAKRWSTPITSAEFRQSTQSNFPEYLKKDIKDSVLSVFSNGEMNYAIKGVHAKVSVVWNFKAPEGTGDTHYSVMRGTKANLVIRQGKEELYKPTLYIEPTGQENSDFNLVLTNAFKKLDKSYPGLSFSKSANGYIVVIPEVYKKGHEAHFYEVTKNYLNYLKVGSFPVWEVPNMLAKYYTTTQALEYSSKNR
ncbi:MAG: putative oxidoreductase C-terminal domain-containing protein [Sphingobacteriaceae bacterium]